MLNLSKFDACKLPSIPAVGWMDAVEVSLSKLIPFIREYNLT